MKIPNYSLYSLSISLIAITYLILSLKKIITQSKLNNTLLKSINKPIDSMKSHTETIAKNKFDIRILKILHGFNELKIFFVNQGEKLYDLKCQGISSYRVILEIESNDLHVDNNETGVILIKDITNNLSEVELLFEYMTDQKINKKKRVSINTVTKGIAYLG
jgi:hypothetical protein